MPPKRATRSGSATKKAAAKPARAAPSTKAPSTNKVTKSTKPKKREATPPTRTSARIASRASSAAPSIALSSIAPSSIAASAPSDEELPLTATIGAPSVRTRSTSIISVPETAIETIEEVVEEPVVPIIFEEEEEEEVAAPIVVEDIIPAVYEEDITPEIIPAVIQEDITREPEEPQELVSLRAETARMRQAVYESNKNKMASRSTAIRFHYAIAKPAAEMAAAQALGAKEEAAMAAEKEREFSAPSPLPSAAARVESPKTGESPKTPPALISASPWGLRTMFSSVKRIFGRNITPSQQSIPQQSIPQQSIPQHSIDQQSIAQQSTPQQHPSQQLHSSQQSHQLVSSPFSPPSPQMTPLISPSARKQQQQGRTPSVPQTPTPAPETSETPIRSERRRGLLPGSVNPQRTPRNKDTPRPKPVERNADKRAQNLEQAAERKRIQEQADALEEEKRKAEQKQHQLDAQDSSQHHAGDKRKRVRIDDLKTIPARRPGESSGTFSFRPEFFEYDSDPEEDDYVEMDIDEAEELVISRPAKKIRYEDNVFNTPQTPVTSLQRQIGQATQYTPKQPSSLRRVSGIGSSGTTPRQISAATPAPVYYRTPAPLGDITEITEPSETPMPAPRSQAPAPTPGSNAFGFPAAADLWVNIPGITREMVEDACKIPPSQVEIDAAARQFAAGVEAYLAVH